MSQLEKLKNMLLDEGVPPFEDVVLEQYLDVAEALIIDRRYPFGEKENLTMPSRYKPRQLMIAVELLTKIGAEGETSHSENGIQRTYARGLVSPELLADITPIVGSLGGGA